MSDKNKHLIDTFKTLVLQYQQELKETKDASIRFKISTFRKTVKILEALDFEVTSGGHGGLDHYFFHCRLCFWDRGWEFT